MQDAIAIAIAVGAGLWLVRTLWRQVLSPGCGKAAAPGGGDGFVPLGDLTASVAYKKPERPLDRPGS